MLKRVVLLGLSIVACTGVTCRISVPDGDGNGDGTPPGFTQAPLDQTDATITIRQSVGASTASVAATITASDGRNVILDDDQSVSINGVELSGPDSEGEYTATVDAASEYVIGVVEPTRGVEQTTVDAPAEFQITSPAEGGGASLSGFTLRWSRANNRLQVRIKLSQTLFGTTSTSNFGPFIDTGSHRFDNEDLEPTFKQGADLVITVTKINTVTRIDGFSSASVSTRVSTTGTASPRP
jgi:hypothetical protein